MVQRMSKRRLSAAVDLLEKGLDDFVYDFRQEGFVDITTDDADIRAQISQVSVDGVCGVYEDDDVRSAARRYRDGKAALEILTRRLRGPRESGLRESENNTNGGRGAHENR